MGSPVRRLLRARLRTILIVSGAAAAVLTLAAFALVKTDGSAEAARAAQVPPKAAEPRAGEPPADGPRPEPTRAARGGTRSPEPSRKKKTGPPKDRSDVTAGEAPKPKAEKKKKKKRKVLESGSCEASYYWQGQMTASGEPFDPSELTAAHKTLPMGSKVRVTNKNNGRSVTVRINDRGPFVSGRCLDLSRAAMKKVGGTGSGVIPVRYEVLSRG
ncbi:septal ring lytic transglycosylase RlpA family protein [Actinomadura sp. GC306]|uniref:septal ring lytic transglycosylase RlpA family protein n=1 Tax=Actinomadura sp. GC306 TaxID=2530367 RepID=UPI00104FD26C|nr:septal ring lytic transglycosylase RlpA family protein [Actinomadura sp. GC306]TDC64941.1 septal ring lytic transglycosylase RlpA family protein [Actinomadura sp. GC306]